MEYELLEDGTLVIKVDDITKISRVLIEDDTMFCRMFYQEESDD